MTQLTALKSTAEKIEAGTWDIINDGYEPLNYVDQAIHAYRAVQGDMNDAIAFHDALVPEWDQVDISWITRGIRSCQVEMMRDGFAIVLGEHENLATALVLASITAKIVELEAQWNTQPSTPAR